jgi:hypothetical protein
MRPSSGVRKAKKPQGDARAARGFQEEPSRPSPPSLFPSPGPRLSPCPYPPLEGQICQGPSKVLAGHLAVLDACLGGSVLPHPSCCRQSRSILQVVGHAQSRKIRLKNDHRQRKNPHYGALSVTLGHRVRYPWPQSPLPLATELPMATESVTLGHRVRYPWPQSPLPLAAESVTLGCRV